MLIFHGKRLTGCLIEWEYIVSIVSQINRLTNRLSDWVFRVNEKYKSEAAHVSSGRRSKYSSMADCWQETRREYFL